MTVDADYVVTNTHGSEFGESISMENVSKLSDKTLSATAMTTRPPMADGVYTNKRRGRTADTHTHTYDILYFLAFER